VRFLHLTSRQVVRFNSPLAKWAEDKRAPYQFVDSLQVGNREYYAWQEAEDHELSLPDVNLGSIVEQPFRREFALSARQWQDPLIAADGSVPGVLLRNHYEIKGIIELSAEAVTGELFRVKVSVRNLTQMPGLVDRNEALMRSLVSSHILLGVGGGKFVSLLDIPNECSEVAATCHNIGLWPVLVGVEGSADAILASPIILYDYPQVAPESPGDLFDGTEIDEILTLRILTLTDEEKRQAAFVDERARALISRTEALADEELSVLHGTMRRQRSGPGGDHG
jgi:hypothetical protein